MKKKNTIAFDFDGVLHLYRDGWRDGSIYDPLNLRLIGMIDRLLQEGHCVFIMTTRSKRQIARYFDRLNDAPAADLIPFRYEVMPFWKKFWTRKGVCGICNHKAVFDVLVDDRAVCFTGQVDGLYEQLTAFRPHRYPEGHNG